MMETGQPMTHKKKWASWLLLLLIAVMMLSQMFGLRQSLLSSQYRFLRYLPLLAYNGLLLFVPLLFGAIYGRKARSYTDSFKVWLLGWVSLLLYYVVYILANTTSFTMWSLLGAVFPILASTSVLFSGLVFCLLAEPTLFKWQHQLTRSQNLMALILLTLLTFTLSSGTNNFSYSIDGLYLVLPFAWGMFLPDCRWSRKQMAGLLTAGLLSFLVIVIGLPGFAGVYQLQSVMTFNEKNWNPQFLVNPTSPLLYVLAIVVFVLFRSFLCRLTRRDLRLLIPVIIFMDAPITTPLMGGFALTASVHLNRFLLMGVMLLAALLIRALFEHVLSKQAIVVKLENELTQQTRLVDVMTCLLRRLGHWLNRHLVSLMTWAWLFVLSFGAFLVVSSNLRIQTSTVNNVNAITYLLGFKLFAIILTAIFLAALFALFYLTTTRYWFSLITVSTFAVGWSFANKIKLSLSGEPIYPTELKEIVNWRTLLPMVGQKTVMGIAILLLILVVLTLVLELKWPISFRHGINRSFWLLASLCLFITPFFFNHEGSPIAIVNRAFDNVQSFRNPQRDIQTNGPILNFLSYVDLQVMTRPQNYSQSSLVSLNKKYRKVAAQINRTRHHELKDQTVIFNLSESYIDPLTVPTVKFAKGTADPTPYIRSLSKNNTYGYMLSAGYGGGTADMEYETLTGFSMNNFKSVLTPYVQIVPRYHVYPTIAMSFPYASGIHPFIGTYYSRIEDYQLFKFNKFVYLGSQYKILDQKHLGTNQYLSDETTYANGLRQVTARKKGQFINLISIQNHMPYDDWYQPNEFKGKVSGKLLDSEQVKAQFATFTKGVQYTDKAVKAFIEKIDAIQKPITLVFYGDHYPSIIGQQYLEQYPIQLHATRYFIYSNKYARQHGAKAKLSKTNYVNTSDFIAMMLTQTNSKVTPYQALLTKLYQELPTMTLDYTGQKGFELVNQQGKVVDPKTLTSSQRALLKDYALVKYDMTAGKGYSQAIKGFYAAGKKAE